MKELSLEQKARAYDEALERAKTIYKCSSLYNVEDALVSIFPELKEESEDEKIRKALLNEFIHLQSKGYKFAGLEGEEIISWLEKKGEQKATDNNKPKFKVGDKVCAISNRFECTIESIDESTYYGDTTNFDIKDQDKWKLIEQKPTEQVEPKFKVGDWVVDRNGTVQQILSYKNGIYKHTNGYSSKMFEDEWRLWDITKNAKDGDVLVHNDCTFIFMGIKDGIVQALEENFLDGTNPVPFGEPNKDKNYHPATKEQRDHLFAKMNEAGYEWDTENKQLKKISQRMISAEAKEALYDKPTWSTEDEEEFKIAIETLHAAGQYSSANWLKSLKDRVQPQSLTVTDEELAQAKKDAYNDALYKIEYHSGEPTFDDGWSAAIWYLKKRNALPHSRWKPSEEIMKGLNEIINKLAISPDIHEHGYLYERKHFNKGICPDCGEMLQYQGDVDGDQQWQCNNCKYTTYIR